MVCISVINFQHPWVDHNIHTVRLFNYYIWSQAGGSLLLIYPFVYNLKYISHALQKSKHTTKAQDESPHPVITKQQLLYFLCLFNPYTEEQSNLQYVNHAIQSRNKLEKTECQRWSFYLITVRKDNIGETTILQKCLSDKLQCPPSLSPESN